LEERGEEGKVYGEVNLCLGVLKKNMERFWGGFEGLHLSNFKVPLNWGFWGVKHTN